MISRSEEMVPVPNEITWNNVTFVPYNGHCFAATELVYRYISKGVDEVCIPLPSDLEHERMLYRMVDFVLPACGGLLAPLQVLGRMEVPCGNGMRKWHDVTLAGIYPVSPLDPVSTVLASASSMALARARISFMGLPLEALSEFAGDEVNAFVRDPEVESMPLARYGPAGQQRYYRDRFRRYPRHALHEVTVQRYAATIQDAAGRSRRVLALVQVGFLEEVLRVLQGCERKDGHSEVPEPVSPEGLPGCIPFTMHPAMLRNLGVLEPMPGMIKHLVEGLWESAPVQSLEGAVRKLFLAGWQELGKGLSTSQLLLMQIVLRKLTVAAGRQEGTFEDLLKAAGLIGGRAYRGALQQAAIHYEVKSNRKLPEGELLPDFETKRMFLKLGNRYYLLKESHVTGSASRPQMQYWRVAGKGDQPDSWLPTRPDGERLDLHGIPVGKNGLPVMEDNPSASRGSLAQRVKNEWTLLHEVYNGVRNAANAHFSVTSLENRYGRSTKPFAGGKYHIMRSALARARKEPCQAYQHVYEA